MDLQAQVRSLGFPIDERPYAPHITLVRKASHARRTEPLPESIAWPVEHFVLVRSQLDVRGSKYVAVGRWPKGSS
jgi:2'-5' RNA ligase